MAKAGRPKKHFTDEQVAQMEDMAFQGCQTGTIAENMGVIRQTLDLHKDILRKLTKKRAERKLTLRTAQTEKAVITKDTTMLIWLGKQDLEQADKQELTGKDGSPLVPLQLIVKVERDKDGV